MTKLIIDIPSKIKDDIDNDDSNNDLCAIALESVKNGTEVREGEWMFKKDTTSCSFACSKCGAVMYTKDDEQDLMRFFNFCNSALFVYDRFTYCHRCGSKNRK